jgi:hypothetical protein
MVLTAVLRSAGKAQSLARRFSPAKNVAVMSTKVDSFLSGSSSVYVDQMYDQWQREPNR